MVAPANSNIFIFVIDNSEDRTILNTMSEYESDPGWQYLRQPQQPVIYFIIQGFCGMTIDLMLYKIA